MYRAATYYLTEVLLLDPAALMDTALASYLEDFSISFEQRSGDAIKHVIIGYGPQHNTEDITDKLQDLTIGKRVSAIAKRDPVRDVIYTLQVDMLTHGRTVLEGRDMWEVAIHDADILIYLYATNEVLIAREIERQRQRGVTLSPEDVATIVIKRNADDNARVRGKLLTPKEAIESNKYNLIIDTSNMSPDEILLDVLLKLEKMVQK
jgi:cytidylate kinase